MRHIKCAFARDSECHCGTVSLVYTGWIYQIEFTHWDRVTHMCASELTIIGSDNGLSPGRCQAIIWTNAGLFLIEPLGTIFSEILIEIHAVSITKLHLKMSSAKWRPSCLIFNELRHNTTVCIVYWIYCKICQDVFDYGIKCQVRMTDEYTTNGTDSKKWNMFDEFELYLVFRFCVSLVPHNFIHIFQRYFIGAREITWSRDAS